MPPTRLSGKKTHVVERVERDADADRLSARVRRRRRLQADEIVECRSRLCSTCNAGFRRKVKDRPPNVNYCSTLSTVYIDLHY